MKSRLIEKRWVTTMSKSLFDLTGRLALVTGSSRGIGFTLAKGLQAAGATVVLNGRNEETLKRASGELGNTHYAVFDVTNPDQVKRSVNEITEKYGGIDILVNNAGIQIRSTLEEFEESDWDRILDVNLKGAFVVSKYVVRGMISRRRGKIINICSLMSEVSRPTVGPYAASKGGLRMLTRAMAVEWGKYNIQVNGIGPGYIITEMTKPLIERKDFNSWVKSRTPAGRWGKPEELIGTVVFLASGASDFINGQIIYVDGGILASL